MPRNRKCGESRLDVRAVDPARFREYTENVKNLGMLKNPNLLPLGYIIAKHGPKYVGLSVVWRIENEPRTVSQGNAGVRLDYRGKGIAVAVKLKVIDSLATTTMTRSRPGTIPSTLQC